MQHHELNLVARVADDVSRVLERRVLQARARPTNEGLALRVAVPGDRRANLVRLTQKGVDTFSVQAVAHEAWIDALLGNLDEPATEAMIAGLDDLMKTLERPTQ